MSPILKCNLEEMEEMEEMEGMEGMEELEEVEEVEEVDEWSRSRFSKKGQHLICIFEETVRFLKKQLSALAALRDQHAARTSLRRSGYAKAKKTPRSRRRSPVRRGV